MSERGGRSASVWGVRIALVAALGGLVRLLVMEAVFPPKLVGDEAFYYGTAIHIADGRGHVSPREYGAPARAAWPPGQSWFLSHFVVPDPEKRTNFLERPPTLRPMLRAQVALGTLVVALTAGLGWALFDPRTGLAAGVVAALYPNLVAYSHLLWSETLFTALFLVALIAVELGRRRASLALAALAGVAFGLAGLTREMSGPLAAVCAAWWIAYAPGGARRSAALRAGLMLACAVLVILPWTARNYALFGRIVPVSSAGWVNVREGNTFGESGWLRSDQASLQTFRNAWEEIGDEMERAAFARDQALGLIRAEQPSWILKKGVRTLAQLFAPDSSVFKKLDRGAYGEVPEVVRHWVVALVIGSWILLVLIAVPGIAAAPDAARRALPVWIVVAVFAVHVVANAHSRYRMPLVPLLIAYASWAGLHRGQLVHGLRGRRRLAAGAVLAVFLGFCVPFFWADAASLWSHGTYVSGFRP